MWFTLMAHAVSIGSMHVSNDTTSLRFLRRNNEDNL